MTDKPTILFVDDDESLLNGIRRLLHREFDLRTAPSGPDALEQLREQPDIPVVVTDMTMPAMNGVQFIHEARHVAPDARYIMLTGNGDRHTAVEAVNDAHVVAFLAKPCSKAALVEAIRAAIEDARARRGERSLLRDTVGGSIRVLTELIELSRPDIYSRGKQIQSVATPIAKAAGHPAVWTVDIAAVLCEFGCVSLPTELADRAANDPDLPQNQRTRFEKHADVGADLLHLIPGLREAADIIRCQHLPYARISLITPEPPQHIILGAQIIFASRFLARRAREDAELEQCVAEMRDRPDQFMPEVLEAIAGLEPEDLLIFRGYESATRAIQDLRDGMIFNQDLRSSTGELLLSRGCPVSEALVNRLRNYLEENLISDNIKVLIPPPDPNQITAAAA